MTYPSKKIFVWFIAMVLLFSRQAGAESQAERRLDNLEARVTGLEEYVKKLQPSFQDFSSGLMANVDLRIKAATDKIVVLNPASRRFTKIEANSGTFLISVQKMEKIDNGYQLLLNIGNPNTPTYSGIKMVFRWGQKWDPSFAKLTYEEWRRSLQAAEYTYNGVLEPGSWTDVAVDLVPAQVNLIEYIECEMEINTVKLEKVNHR